MAESYVENMTQHHLDVSMMAKISLTTCFVVACLLEFAWGFGNVSFITIMCFALTLYGMHTILQKKAADDRDLPLYGVPVHMRGVNVFSVQFLKISMRQIWESRESRRVSYATHHWLTRSDIFVFMLQLDVYVH